MMMMKNIKNRSGFTMIELLATITILGILMAVAIGAVSWILDLNEKRYYSTLEKNVALAAESYYADHRASLPKAVGQSRKLLLKTLVEQKYLPDVLDYGKGDCTASLESYVVVTKYSKKDYLYNVYFDCPAYKTKQEDAIKDLSITINFDYDDKKVKESKANIKINSTEDNKIASYEYIIYKDGQNVYNSENVSAGYVDNINRQVKLKDYVPGNIRIVVTAYDMYGNKKTKEKEVAIYNNGLPECGTESPVYNKWTNAKDAKRKVTIKCVNGDITCLRRNYSETFTSDMKTGYITITGTNNQEKKCPVGVYIDKTPPVCGSDDGSKVWTNKNREVTVQCSDATSGCTKEDKGYSKTFSKTTEKGKIEIKDNAGNTTECEVDVYVDKTAPTISGSIESTDGRFQSKNVRLNLNASDNVTPQSNLKIYISNTGYQQGGKWQNYSSSVDWTLSGKYDGNTKYVYVTVKDQVGNTANTKLSYKVYKECTKKEDNGGWTNSGSCSAACGTGTQKQIKKQKDIYTGASCSSLSQTVSCKVHDCCDKTRGGSWSSYSNCTASCGGGTKTRTRQRYSDYFDKDTYSCPTNSTDKETVACNTDPCAPAKPTISNPTGGNWVNYNFSLEVSTTSAANTIGYWQYSYDNSSWVKYADSVGKGKNKITTTPFSSERNQNVYIRACTAKGLCSPAASTRIRIDKTAPYTPTLDWNAVTVIDGHSMKTGLYGNCVGNRCITEAPYDYSVTLQNQGTICYETRNCDISPTTKTSSARNCAYHKRYPCGYMNIVSSAGDRVSNGVSSGVKKVDFGSNVNKYCPFKYSNSSYYVVYARVYYAYDNAGNRSHPLYHWELMNDVFDGNLKDRFSYSNGTWVMKSGASCPTPRS